MAEKGWGKQRHGWRFAAHGGVRTGAAPWLGRGWFLTHVPTEAHSPCDFKARGRSVRDLGFAEEASHEMSLNTPQHRRRLRRSQPRAAGVFLDTPHQFQDGRIVLGDVTPLFAGRTRRWFEFATPRRRIFPPDTDVGNFSIGEFDALWRVRHLDVLSLLRRGRHASRAVHADAGRSSRQVHPFDGGAIQFGDRHRAVHRGPAQEAEPGFEYDHSMFSACSFVGLRQRLSAKQGRTPSWLWSALAGREWQAEIRAGQVKHQSFELAGITFEDPVLLY